MRSIRVTVAASLLVAIVSATSAAGASAGCPPVAWGSLPRSAGSISIGTHLVGVRAGRHDCYDRLVIDLDGPATNYEIRYVPELTHDGSGLPVPVSGGAILQIIVRAPAYDDAGQPTITAGAVDGLPVSGYSTFRDVAWAGSFEGQTTLGLGVRARLPFRAFTLDGPGSGSRLIVDVAHHW